MEEARFFLWFFLPGRNYFFQFETQKWGEIMFSLLTHLRFFILSFIYGTKLLNYIKIGFQDILDNNQCETLGSYILCECSFSVFSTNKLRAIVFSCKYQKTESGNFLILKTKLEYLNIIEFLIPYPFFSGWWISTQLWRKLLNWKSCFNPNLPGPFWGCSVSIWSQSHFWRLRKLCI